MSQKRAREHRMYFHFDNDEKIYMEILHSFVISIRSLLEPVEKASEQTLDNYKIKVHGIKGTSLDIYAEKVGQEARNLENAAKSGDYSYIEEHNESFVKTTKQLIHDIETMLAIMNSRTPKEKKDKPDRELLQKLLAACNDFNMDGADKAITEIEKYQYESDDSIVEWLRENVDMMRFEEISEKLSYLNQS